jgi:hypothetical protein
MVHKSLANSLEVVRYCALERNQSVIRLKKVALNSLYKATEMEDFVQLTP